MSSLMSCSCCSPHSYFHCSIYHHGFNDLCLGLSPLPTVNPKSVEILFLPFQVPSTDRTLPDVQGMFVELVDGFMTFPLGPPPSGRCECQICWVTLGLQSNDLSWGCECSLLKDLREILHTTDARSSCG